MICVSRPLAVGGPIARLLCHCHRAARVTAMADQNIITPKAESVLNYWLGDGWRAGPQTYMPPRELVANWYKGGAELDKDITERFGSDCEAMAQGAFDDWPSQSAYTCLGGILIGDQLSRNVWRGTAKAFCNDPRALAWAKALVAAGTYKSLRPIERVWVYMPFMHSEVLEDQQECVRLFQELAEECAQMEGGEALAKMTRENVRFAELHRDIVARWGRFPHRNALLGRASTPEEEAGLADGSILRF